MKELRYALLSDGSSDRALLPLLTWLLRGSIVRPAIQASWADLRRLRKPPIGLPERILKCMELYPCDLLFVHRAAEGETPSKRISEIERALKNASSSQRIPPAVCVVPVRMQEAWLLFDEAAIRRAAGNPNGRQPLQLPDIGACEGLTNPKMALHDALRDASGLSGRRRQQFEPHQAALRLAELIDNFAPLRALSAFQHLERDLRQLTVKHGW
jgi:hypothetical protein